MGARKRVCSRRVNGKSPVIYGDEKQTRDFKHVGDVTDTGSSDTILIQQLAEMVRDGTTPELEVVYESAREADAGHIHTSVEKVSELIGYESLQTIRRVGEFIEWSQANWERSKNRS